MQRRLQVHPPAPILAAMTPTLTDRNALTLHRARATEMLFHRETRAEIEERLAEVNKSFTAPVVVTPCPALWPDMPTVADDPVLTLTPGGHDLVIHALALHWADDPVGQLVQCRRALQPDGLLIAVMFGGQTLTELRQCLAEAEVELTGGLSPRVLPMADIRDAGGLLQRAGLALPVADGWTRAAEYRDAFHLMRDLRAMGEGNALHGRLRRPTRRAVLSRAAAIYGERHATQSGRVRATFEFLCLTGWAPSDGQQKPLRPGSAAQRLADALHSDETRLPKG
jgi:SAM-dependent methyltransferase